MCGSSGTCILSQIFVSVLYRLITHSANAVRYVWSDHTHTGEITGKAEVLASPVCKVS